MADATSLKSQIEALRSNPAGIQRTILNLLDDASAGNINVVDPSNPFVFLLEASTINAAAAMSQSEALTRKQYPSMALTEDELYLHMSDKDYINRFGTPSRTTFTILMGKDELYQRAVDTGVSNIRKIVIPRNTEFYIAGNVFSMQYPIEIRIMSHGGLQVVYDVDKVSPLQTLASNLVEWRIVNIDGVEYLWMDVPVHQFQITTHYAQLSAATGYSKTFSLTDQFYYCRVYASTSKGIWEEITTTHSDQVYDPLTPTVVLRVSGDKLKVTVPHVYLTTGLLERELRIDIYTTKGPLELVLSNYELNSFSAKWKDLDNEDDGIYTAPLGLFSTMAVFSEGTVSGGSNALSFEELRERVITNALGQSNLPITNVQLGTALDDLGYTLVKDVDNITNRIFLASRTLPAPNDGMTITGANSRIGTLQTTLENLTHYRSVSDNGNRVTLLPDTLYRMSSGVLELVADYEKDALRNLDVDALSDAVSDDNFLYTPFHYVLDATEDVFEARAYYLDNPSVDSRQFVEENPSTGMAVASKNVTFSRYDGGYILRVQVRSGATFKELSDDQVVVQLAFRPTGEELHSYINGVLVGMSDKERVYEFHLETDFDIDRDDDLVFTSFSMFNSEERNFASPLLGEFDLLYYVLDDRPRTYEETNIDTLISKDLLPDRDAVFMGLTHERLNLRMGWSLDGLWSNTRSVISSQQYKRYQADVPMLFEENVYERDAVTGNVKITRNGDGSLNYNLLHRKGDPVLDSEGNAVIKHYAGEVVLVDGEPIPDGVRSLWRQVDLMLIDGQYYFATENRTTGYRDTLARTIVKWITEDITSISTKLLEQTWLYFYPQSTLGEIKVMVEEGRQVTIDSAQHLSVTFYLSKMGYRNGELRTALTTMAVETISEVLRKATITNNDIVSKLTAKAGDDVLGIDVMGLGGDENYAALTLTDNSVRCSIAKKLVALADNTLTVEDDVRINFIQHEV